MKLHLTSSGLVAERDGVFSALASLSLDEVFAHAAPAALLRRELKSAKTLRRLPAPGRAPIGSQEVWAAGVTYLRSKSARMEESKDAGGGTFYDKVYSAKRPELFFKSSAARVVGTGAKVRIRADSKWNVPEPELTLAIGRNGRIFGYTIGNDMSSRDIEGENPLYLPQAKVYDGSAALGPCLLVSDPLPMDTTVEIAIVRRGRLAFSGATQLGQIKRSLPSLAEFLFREMSFPAGCFLMTGTGVVPPDNFTLRSGDEIGITIPPVGTLTNTVE